LELTRRLERAQEAHHTARAQALHRVVTGAQAAHIRQLRRAQRGGGAVLGACAGRLPANETRSRSLEIGECQSEPISANQCQLEPIRATQSLSEPLGGPHLPGDRDELEVGRAHGTFGS